MNIKNLSHFLLCPFIVILIFSFGLNISSSLRANNYHSAILKTYADIAHASYEDSLFSAITLHSKISDLVASPSSKSLSAARRAWKNSRVPYQQTEVFRFGNAIVDDWEGRVNSWPLDEGLIDYTDPTLYGSGSDQNGLYGANVIANRSLLFNGKKIDASVITKQLLREHLHEAGGIEANVAIGYHAIEFLLWGQDLNGSGPGAGRRPYTDYSISACTGANCDRRAAYLLTAASILVEDLREMTSAWSQGGPVREAIYSKGRLGLTNIITGMGSLSYGELAGERMKLGLLLHDPEEEHDCFSDNTHNSHYYNAMGIRNVYLGRYTRNDGGVIEGASLASLIKDTAPALHTEMIKHLDKTMDAMGDIVRSAENGTSYDQLIGEGNASGNAIVQAAIDALAAQTRIIEKMTASLRLSRIKFEGSDSLDDPIAVFK